MIDSDNKPVPQDINVVFNVKLEETAPGKVNANIPKELRLTPEVFKFLHQMVAEQGFELSKMNIASVHTEEIKELPNVNLVDQQEK